jgi:hypothetical protein
MSLKSVVSVEYTPGESVTGHCGAMVTAINGHKNSLRRFWMYYLREESDSVWRLLLETPDAIKLHKNARVAWRYTMRHHLMPIQEIVFKDTARFLVARA